MNSLASLAVSPDIPTFSSLMVFTSHVVVRDLSQLGNKYLDTTLFSGRRVNPLLVS
jgi:hypothetical protein